MNSGSGPKRLLLLGATFDTGNMGVGALAAGAVTIARRRFPEASIRLLNYGRQPTRTTINAHGQRVDLPLVNLRFSWKLWLPNNIATLLLLAGVFRLFGARGVDALARLNPWVGAVRDADVALAVSGGDSFSDIYGFARFLYVALPQLLVMALGRPLVVLPQTIGPFRGRLCRAIARAIVRYAALTYSRDASGVGELQSLLGDSPQAGKARFCNDMAFVLEPRPPRMAPSPRPMVRPLVGLNVSGLLMMGGYTRNNMFGLNVDYPALVERIVDMLVRQKDTDLLLVPHVFSGDQECDAAAAAVVHDRLASKYPARLRVVQERHDQSEIKHVIGRCDFFVGSRMHACIAALSQGIPAVGIAYSDKFAGVFDSAGVGHLVLDPRSLSADQIVEHLSRAFDAREVSRRALRERMPAVHHNVFALLDELE
jgi:polysaccharide pyruvyl transferase WcaK-like protein